MIIKASEKRCGVGEGGGRKKENVKRSKPPSHHLSHLPLPSSSLLSQLPCREPERYFIEVRGGKRGKKWVHSEDNFSRPAVLFLTAQADL